MRRRTIISGTAMALAGCLGLDSDTERQPGASVTGTTEPEPPRIDCAGAARPVPEADTADAVAPEPYPDTPDGDDTTGWVTEHERAYVVNELLAEYDLQGWHGLNVEATEQTTYRGGTVVRIAYTYGFETDDAIADSMLTTAAYYVGEGGALRSTASEPELVSDLDPTNDGTPVVCFNGDT